MRKRPEGNTLQAIFMNFSRVGVCRARTTNNLMLPTCYAGIFTLAYFLFCVDCRQSLKEHLNIGSKWMKYIVFTFLPLSRYTGESRLTRGH
jgi:hypothetical protein